MGCCSFFTRGRGRAKTRKKEAFFPVEKLEGGERAGIGTVLVLFSGSIFLPPLLVSLSLSHSLTHT
jgi:hypothetical protein